MSRLETIIIGCALVDPMNDRQVWGDLWIIGNVYIFNAVVDASSAAAWQPGQPPNVMKALYIDPEARFFDRRGVIVVQRTDAALNSVATRYVGGAT